MLFLVKAIKKLTGKYARGYRSPSWDLSAHTVDLLLKHGFVYDSSMMAMDQPYELLANGQPSGLVELPVEWILDDAPYFMFTGQRSIQPPGRRARTSRPLGTG